MSVLVFVSDHRLSGYLRSIELFACRSASRRVGPHRTASRSSSEHRKPCRTNRPAGRFSVSRIREHEAAFSFGNGFSPLGSRCRRRRKSRRTSVPGPCSASDRGKQVGRAGISAPDRRGVGPAFSGFRRDRGRPPRDAPGAPPPKGPCGSGSCSGGGGGFYPARGCRCCCCCCCSCCRRAAFPGPSFWIWFF